MRREMEALSRHAQDRVCEAIEGFEGSGCREARWDPDDGTGTYYVDRILEGGRVFEKVSVNFAVVRGTLSPAMQRAALGGDAGTTNGSEPPFYATGVSVVIHSRSPLVPSAHANYRYFEVGAEASPTTWWFGGGADLTPCYLFDEDARHFHGIHREVCDAYDPAFYPAFKKRCDEYFYIPHRRERRGIGGIFFDNLNDRDPETLLSFVTACSDAFLPGYVPIVERRKDLPVCRRQVRWQSRRRGRYAEFNLTADRGIAFGLKSNGRVESILMALPPSARWQDETEPAPGSEEARLVDVARHPREWA
jgi:coproporphyrinogen III oxidase